MNTGPTIDRDYALSRRTMLRGLGVSMALPWLESVRVWGDEPPAASRPASPRCGSPASSRATASTARNGGPGARAGHGARQGAPAARAHSGRSCSSSAVSTTRRPRRGTSTARRPATCSPGRPGLRRRDSIGDEHRPGSRPADRPPDEGAQPRAGLRTVDGVGSQELLDALQLSHLVELADLADAAGALPRARLRPAVQGRPQQGRQERARRGARRCQLAPREDQPLRPAQARRVSELRPRGRAADRAGRQGPAAPGLAADARPSRTSSARPTAFPRTSPSTCG